MSLEEIEKELKEIEVVPEGRVKLGIVACLLAYLVLSIVTQIIRSGLSSIVTLPAILMVIKESPVKGVEIIQRALAGDYITAIIIASPVIIAGIVGGIVAKNKTKGALAGLITWLIIFTIGFALTISWQVISLNGILITLSSYLDKTLFVDTVLVSIFGAIGGAITEKRA